LPRGTQDDVYAAVTSQNNRVHVVQNLLPIVSIQLGIPLNRFFHLVVAQILFVAKRLDLRACSSAPISDEGKGDALFLRRISRLISEFRLLY